MTDVNPTASAQTESYAVQLAEYQRQQDSRRRAQSTPQTSSQPTSLNLQSSAPVSYVQSTDTGSRDIFAEYVPREVKVLENGDYEIIERDIRHTGRRDREPYVKTDSIIKPSGEIVSQTTFRLESGKSGYSDKVVRDTVTKNGMFYDVYNTNLAYDAAKAKASAQQVQNSLVHTYTDNSGKQYTVTEIATPKISSTADNRLFVLPAGTAYPVQTQYGVSIKHTPGDIVVQGEQLAKMFYNVTYGVETKSPGAVPQLVFTSGSLGAAQPPHTISQRINPLDIATTKGTNFEIPKAKEREPSTASKLLFGPEAKNFVNTKIGGFIDTELRNNPISRADQAIRDPASIYHGEKNVPDVVGGLHALQSNTLYGLETARQNYVWLEGVGRSMNKPVTPGTGLSPVVKTYTGVALQGVGMLGNQVTGFGEEVVASPVKSAAEIYAWYEGSKLVGKGFAFLQRSENALSVVPKAEPFAEKIARTGLLGVAKGTQFLGTAALVGGGVEYVGQTYSDVLAGKNVGKSIVTGIAAGKGFGEGYNIPKAETIQKVTISDQNLYRKSGWVDRKPRNTGTQRAPQTPRGYNPNAPQEIAYYPQNKVKFTEYVLEEKPASRVLRAPDKPGLALKREVIPTTELKGVSVVQYPDGNLGIVKKFPRQGVANIERLELVRNAPTIEQMKGGYAISAEKPSAKPSRPYVFNQKPVQGTPKVSASDASILSQIEQQASGNFPSRSRLERVTAAQTNMPNTRVNYGKTITMTDPLTGKKTSIVQIEGEVPAPANNPLSPKGGFRPGMREKLYAGLREAQTKSIASKPYNVRDALPESFQKISYSEKVVDYGRQEIAPTAAYFQPPRISTEPVITNKISVAPKITPSNAQSTEVGPVQGFKLLPKSIVTTAQEPATSTKDELAFKPVNFSQPISLPKPDNSNPVPPFSEPPGKGSGFDNTNRTPIFGFGRGGGTKPPEEPKPIALFDSRRKKKERAASLFNVLVRKHGKFVRVNTQPLEIGSAIGLGKNVVEHTAAASFKIEDMGGQKLRLNLRGYVPSKTETGVLVQPRGTRMGNVLERTDIMKNKRTMFGRL